MGSDKISSMIINLETEITSSNMYVVASLAGKSNLYLADDINKHH